MAIQHRGSVLAGEEIILRAIFTDGDGDLIDLDSPPVIYIYSADTSEEDIESEADDETYTSALIGPLTATRLSTGYYSYTYTVPDDGSEGSWYDLWVGTINSTSDYKIFTFNVDVGFEADDQVLENNTMVIIELSSNISNSAGDAFLEATKLYYTTTYSPLYASPDLIRLELGRWISYIPDDTLAMMAFLSSKEASFIQGYTAKNSSELNFARQRFVVFDSVLKCLNIPGQGREAGYASGNKKTLGDLSISIGSPVTTISDDIYKYFMEQRQEWWRVVNAGGRIVPGQGLSPVTAVKGLYDPDRIDVGRLWESPRTQRYDQPTVNGKTIRNGRRRGRFGFSDRRRW